MEEQRRRRRASRGDLVPIKLHPHPLLIFFAALHNLITLMMVEEGAGEEEEEEEEEEETPATTEQHGRSRPTPLQGEDDIMSASTTAPMTRT